MFQKTTDLDSLPRTIKPLINQLIDFLQDNWIRVPHVVAIIEERLTITKEEADVHSSLIALTAIMSMINARHAEPQQLEMSSNSENRRVTNDSKPRTRSESQNKISTEFT